MTRLPYSDRRATVLVLAASLLAGCVAAPGNQSPVDGASSGGATASGPGGSVGAGGTGNRSGMGGSGTITASGGNATGRGGSNAASGGGSPSGGTSPGGGAFGAGGGRTASGGGTGAGAGVGNAGGSRGATGGTAGTIVPPNCTLPATVGFQRDVQPFLITTCGGGSGCHVIDGVSTAANGGFNHAYDWLTAGAHASSCPNAPMRFEVVIAVINAANPPTCSNSRKMPPPNATGAGLRSPLTACQIAALQAWLNEPWVTQMHRADDSSPTTPYPMPPFN
jgi:hypothetical protein